MASALPRVVARRLSHAAARLNRTSVGFIGAGNMGSHMAANLVKAGFDVSVFDVNTAAASQVNGATVASTVAEVARCKQVVTMLPNTAHVRDVYEGDGGLLASAAPGSLLVDSSTIDIDISRALHAKVAAAGSALLDAPVSGGVPAAASAGLTFIVGGEAAALARARPLLAAMGKNIVHCGDAGAGLIGKLANNLALAISMVAISEAMSLGARMGMDPKVLAHVLNISTARCWSSDTYNPYPGVMENVPASRGYSGGFSSTLMCKDLSLALAAGRASGQPLPLGAATHQLYQLYAAHGGAKKDFSGICQYLEGLPAAAGAAGGAEESKGSSSGSGSRFN